LINGWIIAVAGLLVAASAWVWVAIAQRRRNMALDGLLKIVRDLGVGRLNARADTIAHGKTGELARAINTLAARLRFEAVQAEQDQSDLHALLGMLNHSSEAALKVDLSHRIASANAAAESALGINGAQQHLLAEAVPQRPVLDLYRMSQESNDIVVRQTELQLNGRAATCQVILAPLLTENRRHGTFVLIRDLTDIVQTTQMKTDFVSNASHELRTPLASIRAAVETIRDCDYGDDKTRNRCVDIIESQVIRLQLMVQDLLDLSRAEDSRGNVRRDRLELNAIADMIKAMYGPAAAEKSIEVRTALQVTTVRGDERLLLLTLKNLVDNAIKFTPPCGSVTISSVADDSCVAISVTDTGCGIPEEDQQRVFERFYTVNRSRGGVDRGTGLGLAIVKHAVASMGGVVQLESTLGKGTTIRTIFPISQPLDSEPHDATSAA
jgi:two-component system phosphate regulon sensor histidine kinase PhoR